MNCHFAPNATDVYRILIANLGKRACPVVIEEWPSCRSKVPIASGMARKDAMENELPMHGPTDEFQIASASRKTTNLICLVRVMAEKRLFPSVPAQLLRYLFLGRKFIYHNDYRPKSRAESAK
jgi:hypothetical protein